MKRAPKVVTYTSTTQDFVKSADQNHHLPASYRYYHGHGLTQRCFYHIIYFLAYLICCVYGYLWLGIRIKGKRQMKRTLRKLHAKSSFIYGNHTLPGGDIALSVLMNYPHHISAVVALGNIGIPVIGPMLHQLDFLAVPHTLEERKNFKIAMTHLVEDGTTFMIYPEAHVWPWYTKIRDFSSTSMRYPVRFKTPSFVATTTFHRRRFAWLNPRPAITVYIDGPFYPDNLEASEQEQKESLHAKIVETMRKRAELSDYQYVIYHKEADK